MQNMQQMSFISNISYYRMSVSLCVTCSTETKCCILHKLKNPLTKQPLHVTPFI